MKRDLTTTSSWRPQIPLSPIKTIDQHFNGLHHRAIMVRWIWCHMGCGRLAHEDTTFCPMSDYHICPWPSRYVLVTYLAAPQASWHQYLRLRQTIHQWLLVPALYQIRNPVVTLHHIPSKNRWSDRMCQCSFRTIFLSLCFSPTGWLVPLAFLTWVHHQ
jgi:hypothetical protein